MNIDRLATGDFDLSDQVILIIDDDPNSLAIVTGYLEECRCTVLIAEDGESGLLRADYVRPDLILLDIMMPGMDGFETCRRLKAMESTRDIPVIFMTALAETDHKLKGFAAGAVDYVTKPIQQEEVAARVGVHLRLRELATRLQNANELLEKRVEERTATLRNSQQRLADIINLLPDATFAVNLAGEIILWNRNAEEVTGVKAEKMIGEGNQAYATPFFGAPRPSLVDQILNPSAEIEALYQNFNKDDDTISGESYTKSLKRGEAYMLSVAAPLYDSEGVVMGAIESLRDISERKQAEEESKRNELRLKRLVDILQHPAVTTKEFLEYALEQAIQLTKSKVGYIYHYYEDRKEFVLSMWSKDVMAECAIDKPPPCYELDKTGIWGEAVRQRKAIVVNDFQADNPLKKGYPEGHVQLNTFMTVPIFRDESIVGVVGLANKETGYDEIDILQISLLMEALWKVTDRKMAEEENANLQAQLSQAQKMEAIGTLAGGIAHDFNNILGPIIGYADMALDAVPLESPVFSYIQEILQAADRAKDLVKQILTFSRKGQQDIQPLRIQLVIKEALKLLRASLPTTIEFKQQIDNTCGTVLVDPTQIHQIIMNLCTNAYYAMRETGGVLGVSLTQVALGPEDLSTKLDLKEGLYVRLEVSDTGSGMENSVLERIFDPFYTTKAQGEGTGLGLSVVHGIVKSLHGDISVYSEVGRGTTFHIYFPVVDVEVEKKPDAVPVERLPTGTEHLMVIDDDDVLVKMERQILQSLGYQVTIFTNPEEGLAAFRNSPESFDLIITDMVMPKITGIQLAEEVLALRTDIPVIMCTGCSELINEDQAKAAGIRKFIMKPIGKREFAVAIRQLLDEAVKK